MTNKEKVLKCKDCGKLYEYFLLNTTVSCEQWELIHPEGLFGILCANCMVKRAASKIPGVCSVKMVFETVKGKN